MPGRPVVALVCHAVIFLAWHLRTFTLVPSLLAAVLVACVIYLAGMAWGRQVQRGGTVVWSMTQHALFLRAMTLFDWT